MALFGKVNGIVYGNLCFAAAKMPCKNSYPAQYNHLHIII
jgi:hypothetical protein